MSARDGGTAPAGGGDRARPRRRAWDWSAALVLLGLAAKALLSTTVDETLGTWVGSAIVFAGTVTFVVSTWSTVRRGAVADAGPGGDAPPRDEGDGLRRGRR